MSGTGQVRPDTPNMGHFTLDNIGCGVRDKWSQSIRFQENSTIAMRLTTGISPPRATPGPGSTPPPGQGCGGPARGARWFPGPEKIPAAVAGALIALRGRRARAWPRCQERGRGLGSITGCSTARIVACVTRGLGWCKFKALALVVMYRASVVVGCGTMCTVAPIFYYIFRIIRCHRPRKIPYQAKNHIATQSST